MSEHRVLDFDTPLAPDDIEVGNVILLHGQPRTITQVTPYHETRTNTHPHLAERLYADMGEGNRQVFYVVTCGTCGEQRAFPGLATASEWYGVRHDGWFRLYCSLECILIGLDETPDQAHT